VNSSQLAQVPAIVLALVVAVVVSFLLTPLAMRFARRFGAIDHPSLLASQVFQQRKLFRSEGQAFTTAGRSPRSRIYRKIVNHDRFRSHHVASSQQGPQARQKLGYRKRLRKIVIGAAVQTLDSILQVVTRSQHDDRDSGAIGDQAGATR